MGEVLARRSDPKCYTCDILPKCIATKCKAFGGPNGGHYVVLAVTGNCPFLEIGRTCAYDSLSVPACNGNKYPVSCTKHSYAAFEIPPHSSTFTFGIRQALLNAPLTKCDTVMRCNWRNGCGAGCPAQNPVTHSNTCGFTIDVNSVCNIQPKCKDDSQCSHLNGDCAAGVCSSGVCRRKLSSSRTVCRRRTGRCDLVEFCTGRDAGCPPDQVVPNGKICRRARSRCDAPETCDGTSTDCPANAFKPEGAICSRASGDCEEDSTCTGDSPFCPRHPLLPQGHVCRAAADECDLEEVCTGDSRTCPDDDRMDFGYATKCGSTCYTCGIPAPPLDYNKKGKSKGPVKMAGCNMGNCKEVVELPYPDCTSQCINPQCDNGKDLGHYATFTCDSTWQCDGDIIEGDGKEVCF